MVARLPSACASSDAPWLPSQPSFLASSTLVEPTDPRVLTWLHHYSSTSVFSSLYPLSGSRHSRWIQGGLEEARAASTGVVKPRGRVGVEKTGMPSRKPMGSTRKPGMSRPMAQLQERTLARIGIRIEEDDEEGGVVLDLEKRRRGGVLGGTGAPCKDGRGASEPCSAWAGVSGSGCC
uniref:Uncharacterized protein n=1 Tax=Oryza meridionalis TaxID=40149 RepID=A0A0E0C2L8_9ORYZ